jgi:hypothetical protein
MNSSAYKEYQLGDLVQLRESLCDCQNILEQKLASVKTRKNIITNLIKKHEHKKASTIVLVPEEILNFTTSAMVDNNNLKWKSIVVQLLKTSRMLVTSNEIVNIGEIKMPMEFCNRKKSTSSVSAALHYLVKEGKVCKVQHKGRGYKYGLTHTHFDMFGNPVEKSIKKATVDAVA